MLHVFERVKTVFKNEYSGKRKSFREGFRTCYELFHIGYSKTSLLCFEVKYYEAKHSIQTLKYLLDKANRQSDVKDSELKDINEQLTKAKEELLDLKTAQKEDLLNAATQPLRQEIQKLKEELAEERQKLRTAADTVISGVADDAKLKRLVQLCLDWRLVFLAGDNGRLKRLSKKEIAAQALNKKIAYEAAKAEDKVAA